MSLRWRIALGFALVALATAAVIALATPPIVTQGFADVDQDEASQPVAPGPTPAALANDEDTGGSGATVTQVPAASNPSGGTPTGQAQEATILRLLLAAAGAAVAASLLGLFAAGPLVRPLTRLEEAAGDVVDDPAWRSAATSSASWAGPSTRWPASSSSPTRHAANSCKTRLTSSRRRWR